MSKLKIADFSERQYIGGGRFSEVFKAVNPQTKSLVALKVTTPDEEGAPHNSRNELELLKRLDHENITSIIGDFTDNFESVMILPYYAFTLNQYVKHNAKRKTNPYLLGQDPSTQKNNLSEDKSNQIIRGIASGLAYLHASGIIHRDIKPENIMFQNFEPIPVIIDLGISFEYPNNHGKETVKITQVSTSIYKAPELIFGMDYSYSIDIWSFGIVMTLIYSSNCNTFIENDGVGDFRLISELFKMLGTPTLETWPEAKHSTTFSNLSLTETEPLPTSQVLPRANDKIREIFAKMMIYESPKRLTAQQIIEYLDTNY